MLNDETPNRETVPNDDARKGYGGTSIPGKRHRKAPRDRSFLWGRPPAIGGQAAVLVEPHGEHSLRTGSSGIRASASVIRHKSFVTATGACGVAADKRR